MRTLTPEEEIQAAALEIRTLRAALAEAEGRLRGREVADAEIWASLGVPLREVPALQKPNQDHVARRYTLFEASGPGFRSDTRMYFAASELRVLLATAERSPLGRAVLHGATVEVEDRVPARGRSHAYRVLRLTGVVEPETP